MAQPPNLLQSPEPVETAELHFKLLCKLKIFESETKYEGGHCCVLAVSQNDGLVFVGHCSGFSVIKTKSLSPAVDSEKFPKRDVILNLRPSHISVDFAQKVLAVVYSSKPGSVLVFYDIQTFSQKDITPMKILPIVKQNVAAEVIDITWQPVIDGTLMICLTDGSVMALSQAAKDGPIFNLPNTTQATCFCWSPKGKQIVIGTATGSLTQYKPDLKVVKTLPPPPIFNGVAMVVSVLWISSFQFAVAYNDRANPESFPVITIVNAAKNEPVNVVNYDDITFSSTLFRNHQIYMSHQNAWNLIFVSSANSIEVAVLHSKDGSAWEQWLLGDASRAELPLNPDRQETFPLGWAFDFTSQETIPWGEGSLPPMPRLLLISDEGILCVFNVVNTAENAAQLCAPPKVNIDDSLFVSSSTIAEAAVPEPPKAAPPTKSLLGSPPTLGSSKPTYTFEASPGFGGFGVAKPQTMSPQGPPIVFPQQHEHQKPQQPQQQLQMQQQSQATPIQTAPATTFKLPAPQFGTPPTFSFGTNSVSISPKPDTMGSVTVPKVGTPQPISLTKKSPIIQGDIFSGKTPPQSTPIKQTESFTEKTTTSPAQSVKKPEEVAEQVGKSEAQSESPAPGTPELAAVDDSVYLSALEEEIEHFNSELQQLSAKVCNFNIKVGTDEDKAKMKKNIDDLYDFWKELKETTKAQNSEIHTVVVDLMEAFAWLEDAKSRNLQKKNPSYIELKKSEELDPLSARHMNEINHLKYYIENQVKQLTSYLEKEWMEHQENYRNEVKGRLAVPPLEEVHKTIVYQLKILHKQKILVEELKEKIAIKKRKNKPESFLNSTTSSIPTRNNQERVSELSKLAENLLQLKITKEENSPHNGCWEMMKAQLSAISERSRKLTRTKQTVLRDALSECDMVKIRPVKTTLESSTFLRSLALEKAAKLKSQAKSEEPKQTEKNISSINTIVGTPKAKHEMKPFKEFEKPKENPFCFTKMQVQKNLDFLAGKPAFPQTVHSLGDPEGKSPLTSLSGIVSNIGKKNETKSQQPFPFATLSFQKFEPGKDSLNFFGSPSLDQKQEKPKTPQTFTSTFTQTFTTGVSKPAESIFGKKEPVTFGGSFFGAASSTLPAANKQDLPKSIASSNIVFTAVTATPSSVPSVFTFGAVTTNAGLVGLQKRNLTFPVKEQSSGMGTSAPLSTAPQSSTTSVFGTGTFTFGAANKIITPTITSPGFSFANVQKTTSNDVQFVQPTFGSTTESKLTTVANVSVATTVKPTTETEEVDVVKIDEPVKKPEAANEKVKDLSRSNIFGGAPTITKTVPEVTTSSVPPNVTLVSTTQGLVAITNVSVKPVLVTAGNTVATSADNTATASVIVKSTTSTASTASTFSFAEAMASIPFGQTATTTTATTSMSLFGNPTATTSVVEQVSSTTSTQNIFGGTPVTTSTADNFSSLPATTTASPKIFGESTPPTFASISSRGSNPDKPVFSHTITPSSTSENVFGTFPNPNPTSPNPNPMSQNPNPTSQKPNPTSSNPNPTPSNPNSTSPNPNPTPPNPNPTSQNPNPMSPNPHPTSSNPNPTSPTTSTFEQVSNPSTPTVFGQKTDAAVSQTTNLFGQLLESSRSVFENPTSNPNPGGKLFDSSKIFGGGSSTTTSSSIFPQTTSNFGQATTTSNIFGQTQANQSFFGQNICPAFGGGTSPASGQATFDSGGFNKLKFGERLSFGQGINSPSIFGGSSNPSIFGEASSTTSSNVFQTPTTSTTFGSTTSTTFGSTSAPGPFSGGASSFGDTSFGSTATSFQKPLGGFGSPPAFRGAPGFGGTHIFGRSPGFGSSPAYGGISQGTFGQSAGSTTFENFANQNTVGFGNLAQQSQNQSFGATGFGSSSFEKNSAFGGDSFCSWRSK